MIEGPENCKEDVCLIIEVTLYVCIYALRVGPSLVNDLKPGEIRVWGVLDSTMGNHGPPKFHPVTPHRNPHEWISVTQ